MEFSILKTTTWRPATRDGEDVWLSLIWISMIFMASEWRPISNTMTLTSQSIKPKLVRRPRLCPHSLALWTQWTVLGSFARFVARLPHLDNTHKIAGASLGCWRWTRDRRCWVSLRLYFLITLSYYWQEISYACASYKRNTNFIRVPTTVIGLIDASVSIKVAVNYGNYKNRLGAYHAPIHTFLDFTFLRTLPTAQIRNGFAELIKISTCAHLDTFNLLDKYVSTYILFQQVMKHKVLIQNSASNSSRSHSAELMARLKSSSTPPMPSTVKVST